MDENVYRDHQFCAGDNDVRNGSSTTGSFNTAHSLEVDQDLVTDIDMNENSERHQLENSILAADRGDPANHIQNDCDVNSAELHPVMNGSVQENVDKTVFENGEDFNSNQEPIFELDQTSSFAEIKTSVSSSDELRTGFEQPTLQNVTGEGDAHLERSSSHMTVLKTGSPVGNGLSETGKDEEVGFEEETFLGKKADFCPVPTPLLPALEEPVPDSWACVEGDFVLVMAVYQTHLGSDMLAAPDARLQDGLIHLMMVRKGVSKANLFRLFLSFSQGNHVSSPYVEVVKVLAFRLEPHSSNGNIMVDGERFEPAPIQAQILPGLARVMAIK
ncbi:sphingosine kinase 2 [Elysia marginata]|uniref:Sphingosine kinase 2 n=1 Tax=Elysia marginata TaxID=1093978 RepID=A0AAV4IRM7_9GAST|nr:sphingosine kinase 2 [Elysia marginata]